MVIIQTGLETAFGTDGYSADAPGFSADAVQWLVDRRRIGGIGSDSYGPDATSDEFVRPPPTPSWPTTGSRSPAWPTSTR